MSAATGAAPLPIRWYYASSLARGLLTASALVYSNGAFVSAIGSRHYASVVFYAQVGGMALYFAFMLVAQRSMNALYSALVAASLALCAGHGLAPSSHGILFGFALAVFVLDIVGLNVMTASVQDAVSPSVVSKVFQRILLFDLIGRTAGSALMMLVGAGPLLWLFYPVCLGFGGFHLACGLVLRAPGAARGAPAPGDRASVTLGRAWSALRFVFGNPLVRVALVALIWARFSKFLVELAYFGELDAGLGDAGRISSFAGAGNTASIALSIAFQSLASERLFSRLSLSSLFSLLPAGILCLCAAALAFPAFWPMIALMVFFQCAFRVVHFPAFRQCLTPVPKRLSQTIFSVVNLMSLLATMLISGGMSGFKGAASTTGLALGLIALSGAMLFVLANLDSFYVQNLWSHYKEKVTGRWFSAPAGEALVESPAAGVEEHGLERPARRQALGGARARAVLKLYVESSDEAPLRRAVEEHRALLRSASAEDGLAGVALMSEIGLPEFNPHLALLRESHPHAPVRTEAAKALRAQVLVRGLAGDDVPVASLARARELLLDARGERELADVLRRLSALLQSGDRAFGLSWLEALEACEGEAARRALWDCVDPRSGRISLRPLVSALDAPASAVVAELRAAALGLARRDRDQAVLRRAARLRLIRLLRSGEAAVPAALPALFLEEWRLGGAVARSLDDFERLQGDELQVLTAMHLEFLKDSELAGAWKLVFARDRDPARVGRALAHLRTRT